MAEPTGHAVLIVERDGQDPRRLDLGGRTFRIGRSPENDLQVSEPFISKHHAEIRADGAHFVIVDCNSRAGVLVNGKAVREHRLAPQDVIELGAQSPVRLRFEPAGTAGARRIDPSLSDALAGSDRDAMSRLARFFEFSRKLAAGLALDEVLRDVVALAIDVTHAERGMLILRSDDGTHEVHVARTSDGRTLPQDGLRVSETLVRQAFEHGKVRIVNDVTHEAELAIAESIVSLELRTAVTLPLLRFVTTAEGLTARSEMFGLIYLDSRQQRRVFDGLDLRILERLAQDAASVIENARLFEQAEQKKQMERELMMAREVQAALMPERFVSTSAFSVAGTCVPCHDLGGDYVDQFDLGEGRMAVVIADVCGKGIAASLLAAAMQGALAAEITEPHTLDAVAERLNRVQCRIAPTGKFVTAVLAVLEPDGVVRLVNAGHCPPLHVHRGGVTEISEAGMALGIFDGASYEVCRVALAPGDALVLFTDGVVECEGKDRELFGWNRVHELLRGAHGRTADQLLADVTAAVDTFRGIVPVSDDSTVLVLRRH